MGQTKKAECLRRKQRQKEHKARMQELEDTLDALHTNDAQFEQACEDSYIEQLIYQHAALMCRCRALYRVLRSESEDGV